MDDHLLPMTESHGVKVLLSIGDGLSVVETAETDDARDVADSASIELQWQGHAIPLRMRTCHHSHGCTCRMETD